MDKTEEDIIRFELMLRATDPEQRMRACAGLQTIVQKWQGTPYAKRAKQSLDNSNHQNTGEEHDPELSGFASRWIGIHNLTDVRLPNFLRELQSKPAIAARLRREVIKDLRQWISEALPKIGPQTPAEEIKALNSFLDIPALKIYEAEMDEAKQLRNALFQVRYQRVKREVATALGTWSFDGAWSALQKLSNPPASFEKDVTQLQDEIYKADQKHQEVNRLLDKSPQNNPAAWTEASSLINYARELAKYLHDDVPDEWRQRISAVKQKSMQDVARFLETTAGKTREFHEIRAFQAAYENLQLDNRDAGVSLRKEWFQNALDLLTRNVERDIAESDSPEALDVLRLALAGEQAGLPDIFVEQINAWRIRIDEISSSWKTIRNGDEFPVRMPSREPMPKAFIQAIEFFGQRLNRVKEALAKLEIRDGADAEQVYVEAIHTADEILRELENHILALKLKEKAEHKLTYHRINGSIAKWQIELLLELCRPRKQQALVCGYYIANERLLRLLQELVKEKPFSSPHEAEGWWQLWRARCEKLPAQLPEALSQALQREQENRADQWHAVLATLSDSPMSPEKCEEIAASLKGELQRLDLQWRQTDFLHKATVGYAERSIKSKKWQQAEEKIAELDEDDETTRRLKTFLAVEKARQTGVGALSQVLKRDWSHISLYLEQEAHVILAEAVADAWERKEDETLKNLRMVVSRLLATGAAPPKLLKEFAQWEEWLTVESYVRRTGGMACVKKLVSYLDAQLPPDVVLGKRLERLISYWQEQNDAVMLAWAYEAFQDYVTMPLYRPVEELKEQHSQLAIRHENTLRTDGQLLFADLKTMQSELKQAEDEWARLTDYLNELPRALPAIKLSAKFYEVKELLSELIENWTTLDQLESADLRELVECERLNACRRTLIGKFDGIALQAKLLEHERRLVPLTQLNYLQNRIHEAADNCGDGDKFDEKGLFNKLFECLNNMIEVFRQTDAKGGPLWQLISAEYCITMHARAGSLLTKPSPPDLSALAEQFANLQAEEETLVPLWQQMWMRKPIIPSRSTFEPESYLDYLSLFPEDPPHSRRGYIQFKRNFAMSEPVPTILAQSRRYLPEWICKYLDEGIPHYTPEA